MTSDFVLLKILRTHFDSLADLLPNIAMPTEALRAEAELDGIVLWGSDAIDIAKAKISDLESPEAVSAATLVALTLEIDSLFPQILRNFCSEDSDIRNATRLALRLGSVEQIIGPLHKAAPRDSIGAQVALADLASFHRQQPPRSLSELIGADDDESRAILVEALGRFRQTALLSHFEEDTDPIVRRVYWRSLALASDTSIVNRCRHRCAQSQPCHDAIRFLGVVGSVEDIPLLTKLAIADHSVIPAVQAMGLLGATEVIPELLGMLSDQRAALAAAAALERITGRAIPRSAPPIPPSDLTEDELDFWFHPGEPIPEAARNWWKQNHHFFDRNNRYQSGICVSQDPLGKHFESLPYEVRETVYLRQRALDPKNTPDWELSTWPKFTRTPAWSSLGLKLCEKV